MSLLDEIANKFKELTSSDHTVITNWIEQQGGITALIEKFRQGGLTDAVESWLGTGPNKPVTGEQIEHALGSDAVQQLSQSLNKDKASILSLLAEFIPSIINKLSPEGKLTGETDLMTKVLQFFKGK